MSKIDELIDKYYKRGDWIFVEELNQLRPYIGLAELILDDTHYTIDFHSAEYDDKYYKLLRQIKE